MMSPHDLWVKALTSARSARNLLKDGDGAGAASRAYYAMFNAARAVLWLRAGIEPEASKKHATVIRRFSEQFVKSGELSAEFGQLLSKAAETRFIADYDEIGIEIEVAKDRVESMERFIQAIEAVKDRSP